jgi:glycosyltransferase involved in cell wall biosynthesis
MKVSYDSFVFRMQKYGGISRYFQNLVLGFQEHPNLDIQVSLFEGIPSEWEGRLNITEFSNSSKLQRIKRRLLSTQDSSLESILHLTYYSNPLRTLEDTELILTLHDFSPEDYPDYFPSGNPHLQKLELMRTANKLICVSNFTADRALHYQPDARDKIVVIPLASTIKPLDLMEDQLEKSNYILVVGRPDSYKNYQTVIHVWLSLPNLKLMLFGLDELPPYLSQLIPEGRRTDIIFKVGSDDELRRAYIGAKFYLNTSYCEGFSIPMLEAISLGCPAIGGPLDVYRELYGDSVILSEDFSVKAFMDAIKLLDDPGFSNEILHRGLHTSSMYSWTRTLNSTAEVYKSL